MAKILYFDPLADMLHQEAEQLVLPADVTNVSPLLAHLRKRGNDWALYLTDVKVQLTSKRQFSSVTSPSATVTK